MRTTSWIAIPLATALGVILTTPLAQAIRLADGNVYFLQPPSLIHSTATQTGVFAYGSTYYFTVQVPENAGEPLQRVTITQRNGGNAFRRVHYRLDETIAFVGTRRDRRQSLPIGAATYDQVTETITITFDPAVPPGTTLTLGLKPQRNPRVGGTYLFGVTAYPAGEQVHGQFLGFGRFQFDEPDRPFLSIF